MENRYIIQEHKRNLYNILNKYKSILTNKKTTAHINEIKKATWKMICAEYNSTTRYRKTDRQLQQFYRNTLSSLRKEGKNPGDPAYWCTQIQNHPLYEHINPSRRESNVDSSNTSAVLNSKSDEDLRDEESLFGDDSFSATSLKSNTSETKNSQSSVKSSQVNPDSEDDDLFPETNSAVQENDGVLETSPLQLLCQQKCLSSSEMCKKEFIKTQKLKQRLCRAKLQFLSEKREKWLRENVLKSGEFMLKDNK